MSTYKQLYMTMAIVVSDKPNRTSLRQDIYSRRMTCLQMIEK